MAFVESDAIEGRYANENADAGPFETRLTYGDVKVARLQGLKRTWDPCNAFRLNHNVEPASADGRPPDATGQAWLMSLARATGEVRMRSMLPR